MAGCCSIGTFTYIYQPLNKIAFISPCAIYHHVCDIDILFLLTSQSQGGTSQFEAGLYSTLTI
jgi:hypothetical protein